MDLGKSGGPQQRDIKHKKNKSELKNSLTEIKNTLNGINSRQEEKELFSNLKDTVMAGNQAEQDTEKKIEYQNRFRELSNTIKHNNIHITGKGKSKERRKTIY